MNVAVANSFKKHAKTKTETAWTLGGIAMTDRGSTEALGTRACPVRLTDYEDVVAAATDPERFSSAISSHLHVPNTMDGDEHREFRRIVDKYMSAGAVADLEPMLTEVARKVVEELPRGTAIDAVADFGSIFAVRAQCRWLGWPEELEGELLDWMRSNEEAARAGDPERNVAVAEAFDAIVRRQVDVRREARNSGSPYDDVTARLLEECVFGRPLTVEEIVSMLRNWTAGDLGSLARCVGVVIVRLLDDSSLFDRVRELIEHLEKDTSTELHNRCEAELEAIIDECLRIVDPFPSNGRVATCPVQLSHRISFDADTHFSLEWAVANRDPKVFKGAHGPDTFDAEGNRPYNLVYGIGLHACPGRLLSTVELRIVLSALLSGISAVRSAPDSERVPAEEPLLGWAKVPIVLS